MTVLVNNYFIGLQLQAVIANLLFVVCPSPCLCCRSVVSGNQVLGYSIALLGVFGYNWLKVKAAQETAVIAAAKGENGSNGDCAKQAVSNSHRSCSTKLKKTAYKSDQEWPLPTGTIKAVWSAASKV